MQISIQEELHHQIQMLDDNQILRMQDICSCLFGSIFRLISLVLAN